MYVGTSTKMNLTPSQVGEYCRAVRSLVADVPDRTLFVLPSFPAIAMARGALAGSNVAWGAQDVHPEDAGAHTGDVSAPMLADLGCTFVMVGHHERRRDYHETDELVAAKVRAVQRAGMTALLCIGEESRLSEVEAAAFVGKQLESARDFDPAHLLVAYEPAWAIGTGSIPAEPAWVESMHAIIHERLRTAGSAFEQVPVIYGGSVDPSVAGGLLSRPGVDGLFVGRSALRPEVFAQIAHSGLSMPIV